MVALRDDVGRRVADLQRELAANPSVALAAELREAGELLDVVREHAVAALPWARAELAACA
ncbi:hypothetical protein [Sphingomonas oryzagri]|uniref:Uncharacterized protein n=1 Tax=Sphingomonas oryzagri TaxID=3042314 RepID=A0ABT6N7V2_9SPHN|nr:hypothetical protein [Sphingomonas oryzagri]MDH7641165.1 hypothetical protein [Sphingomonas oryzagri]